MKRYILFLSCFLMVFVIIVAPLFAGLVSQHATGEQRTLVLMTKFPDVNPSFSVNMMRTKYFEKLDRYVRAVSYGKTRVTGSLTDWYTLPHDVKYYSISQHNLTVQKERVIKLIQDAVNLADMDEDFSRYSMIFLSLGVKRADYGMMGVCGYPGMPGW